MSSEDRIRPRDRHAILRSLRQGLVPRAGLQHFQVGRTRETEALARDIDCVRDGGSAVRFVIGEYGSGKTFFLFLIRAIALRRRMVTMHADLTATRRLYGREGQARSLYSELACNTATRTAQDGGALPAVVESFVNSARDEARRRAVDVEVVIHERLSSLSEMKGGYDFAHVVGAYWRGHDTDDEALRSDAVRWLRGEFTTKTEARQRLDVRTIIDDDNLYDSLKLMARFVRLAGFSGLVVCLDEMVSLYKLANSQARSQNYDLILRIVNDCSQGSAEGLGFLFGGTPGFLTDTRRGLYSNAALASRLAENTFATGERVDLTGPVLRLANLSPEDMYVLLKRLRHVQAGGDPEQYLVPDEALQAFMRHCAERIGDAYFRTPRNTIKEFLNLLAVLEQNPTTRWEELVNAVEILEEQNPDLAPLEPDSEPRADLRPRSPQDNGDDLRELRI